jgi:hypothetical protein
MTIQETGAELGITVFVGEGHLWAYDESHVEADSRLLRARSALQLRSRRHDLRPFTIEDTSQYTFIPRPWPTGEVLSARDRRIFYGTE